jgi:hypothetical protein
MIRYGELVKYIKDNHVSWDKDLFDVLKDFFEEYYPPPLPNTSPNDVPYYPSEDTVIPQRKEFKEPEDGEYNTNNLLELFST